MIHVIMSFLNFVTQYPKQVFKAIFLKVKIASVKKMYERLSQQ